MAQRFPVPNTGSNGPPPQGYPPSSAPPNLRQYSGPNFPVCIYFLILIQSERKRQSTIYIGV